ncbi:MAG: hypothetical protein AAGJ35_05705 [Myxococcota bacterium]
MHIHNASVQNAPLLRSFTIKTTDKLSFTHKTQQPRAILYSLFGILTTLCFLTTQAHAKRSKAPPLQFKLPASLLKNPNLNPRTSNPKPSKPTWNARSKRQWQPRTSLRPIPAQQRPKATALRLRIVRQVFRFRSWHRQMIGDLLLPSSTLLVQLWSPTPQHRRTLYKLWRTLQKKYNIPKRGPFSIKKRKTIIQFLQKKGFEVQQKTFFTEPSKSSSLNIRSSRTPYRCLHTPHPTTAICRQTTHAQNRYVRRISNLNPNYGAHHFDP